MDVFGPPALRNQQTPRPAVFKLRGDTPQAQALRQTWMDCVEQKFQGLRPLMNPDPPALSTRWEEFSVSCGQAAVQVCGLLDSCRGAPWLRTKQTDLHALDRIITQARLEDQQARRNEAGLAHPGWLALCHTKWLALRHARSQKQEALHQWEEEWFDSKASEADTAAS